MATTVPFGPGTVKIGDTGTELSFECEVTGGFVTHEYEDVGEAKRKLCGDAVAQARTRKDGVKFDVENDLSASGLYAFLAALPEDPTPKPISYVPNTANGAQWAGTVSPLMPSEVGAGEYGEPIASTVEWPAVGLLTFTAATPS